MASVQALQAWQTKAVHGHTVSSYGLSLENAMMGSTILEVVIGVVFVLIIFSTICAALREAIEAIVKTRAAYLEKGIRELLNDPHASGMARQLFNHPLIHGLFLGEYNPIHANIGMAARILGRNLPSYIPSKNFASALVDIAAHGTIDAASANTGAVSVASIRTTLGQIDNPAVRRVILNAVDLAGDDVNKVIANVEAWFDSGMDRVSGWYKRTTSYIVFGIALFLAALMNVNVIGIGAHLYRNDLDRSLMVDQASALIKDPDLLNDRKYITARVRDATIPIGRDYEGIQQESFGFQLIGWLATALAAALGAPFWFDVLNKVMIIRSTVKPNEKSPPEASEDRQAPVA